MDVITPGFLDPSQNVQYRMKKLHPCVQKVPEAFFPRPITPRCHSLVLPLEFQTRVQLK